MLFSDLYLAVLAGLFSNAPAGAFFLKGTVFSGVRFQSNL